MSSKTPSAFSWIGKLTLFVGLIFAAIWGVLWFTGWTPHQRANKFFSAGRECEDNMSSIEFKDNEREQARECAITNYKEAIRIFKKDWRYHFRLGETLIDYDRQQALDAYLTAFELAPSEPGPADGVRRILNLVEAEVIQVGDGYDIFTAGVPYPNVFVSKESEDIELIVGTSDRYYFPSSEDKRSLQIRWKKNNNQWASMIFGFDQQITDITRALEADMKRLDLSSPQNYALQFALLGVEGGEGIRVKFQDQNILITESLGNQVVFSVVAETSWRLYCIPLSEFRNDPWIQKNYQTNGMIEFNWTDVKQVNVDPLFESTSGTVYLDEVRIVRVSACD